MNVLQDISNVALEDKKVQESTNVFHNMRLRRIVKENHGAEINDMAFFFNKRHFHGPVGADYKHDIDSHGLIHRDPGDTSNVLATVGGGQANIYDNEHCGDHLDIMSHFNVESAPEQGVSEMNALCWMHQEDDAILVAGGASCTLHVLSLAKSCEIRQLKGHEKPIDDIQAYPHDDVHLLSASKDNTVRLWNVATGKCLAIFQVDALCLCFHPEANKFYTGSRNGELREWHLPGELTDLDHLAGESSEILTVDKRQSNLLRKFHNDSAIDCIRYAKDLIISKSINGRIECWHPDTLEVVKSFRVKGAENYCRFDISSDEAYLCCGSSNGIVYIYSLETGKNIAELGHRRCTKAVRCCAFTRNYRTVLCAGEDAFIWRYDNIDDKTLEEWANWRKTS